MTDVWPPPPENQPEFVHYPRRRGRIGALLFSLSGSLMLFGGILVFVCRRFIGPAFIYKHELDFGEAVLVGFLLIIVGGWAGYYTRHTKYGCAALIISSLAVIASGCLCLLPIVYGYF